MDKSRPTKTGIVIPCYNEEGRLHPQLFNDFVSHHCHIHFLFVNDGSTDNTKQKIEEFSAENPKRISAMSLVKNRGKGEAVRSGINFLLSISEYHFLGYWDADLSTRLDEIPRFLDAFDNQPDLQFVCGARIRRLGANIERLWYRHYLGRVFATAASQILHLPVYDTQCGAKLIRAELAKKIFHDPFCSRWLFDIELFARLIGIMGKEEALKRTMELPLEKWTDMGDSKVSLFYLPKVPFELLKIHFANRMSISESKNT